MMKNTTSTMKRVRNMSPVHFSMEPPPAKMTSSFVSAGKKNQEKDRYFSTIDTGVRNMSPVHFSMEPPPAKMTSSFVSAGKKNQEKDRYFSTIDTGPPKYRKRTETVPKKQLWKDDQPMSKSGHPEKQTSSSDENSMLKEALKKSKAVSNCLENELRKHENLLVQATQSKQNLQDEITELDKEKQICITDFHQHYRRANTILKMQNQFDEKIELLAGFLSNESKLKETIASSVSPSSWTKFQETLKFYRKSREEMKTIKRSCHELHDKLRKSVKETLIDDQMESEFTQLGVDFNEHLVLCREKRIQMQFMNEKTQAEIIKLNAETDRVKATTDSERNHMQAKLIGLSKLIKLETEHAHKRKNLIKDQVMKQIAKQKEIIISLTNESRNIVTEIERLSAESRDLKEDTETLKLKYEEVDEEFRTVNYELNELVEKLDTFCGQVNSNTSPIVLQIKIKNKELREMKLEKSQLEMKKFYLIAKFEHFHSIEEYKYKIAELQDQLKTNAQIKETMEEFRAIMKRQLQEKESRIRAATEKANALEERRRKLLEQFNAHNDSLLQEKKASIYILATFSCIKGHENLKLDAKEREVSSTENDILNTLYSIADLELEQDQISEENKLLDDIYRAKRKDLVGVMCEKERTENEIRMIKKFVRDKLYTTVQEINKNINEVLKRKEGEELALNALEENVNKQKVKLEDLKKQRNLTQK